MTPAVEELFFVDKLWFDELNKGQKHFENYFLFVEGIGFVRNHNAKPSALQAGLREIYFE